MADKRPWFPFYAADWLTDEQVVVMSLAARGAYITLLAYHWREGSIPSDTEALRKLVGADQSEWPDLWTEMLGAFSEHAPGRLVNPRLSRMLKSDRASAEHRVEHARTAAKARWSQRVNAPSMPDACSNMLPSESESQSESEVLTTSVSTSLLGTAAARKHINPAGEIDLLVDYQTEVLNKLDGINNSTERKDRPTLLAIARAVPRSLIHRALEETQDARLRALDGEHKHIHPGRYFTSRVRSHCETAGIISPFRAKDVAKA
jgi:uncharacterized protein YdaU (DUF1376 family)